jgi:hypothetical protein
MDLMKILREAKEPAQRRRGEVDNWLIIIRRSPRR